MGFWADKKVIVTGGNGFVGRHLTSLLRYQGAVVFAPDQRCFDLTRQGECHRLFLETPWDICHTRTDFLFHLAATVGGIGANERHPAKFLFDNATMNLFVAREALNAGVKKFVALGSVCAYPKHARIPFREQNLFDGYPEETNAPYGLTKRLLLIYLQSLRQQYGFNGIMLFPTNMYGPGDHFRSRDAHVIPMLIDRIAAAKRHNEDCVTIWGTGMATRDFLYVADAVRGIEAAARLYDSSEPVNLGTGEETSIMGLARLIAGILEWGGEIWTDPDKPDGQPMRVLDITRAQSCFGWFPQTSLISGLWSTIDWYKEQKWN